jgi:hypothetical protein
MQGPHTTRDIAGKLGISMYHARDTLRKLRQKERIAIIGTVPAKGTDQNVWALIKSRDDQFSPLRAKEERNAEQQRWLFGLLDMWARFMRTYWGPNGYPSHTPGMAARARINSFDDLEEENDQMMVSALDACIDSLPDRYRSAVYYRYNLLDVWNGPPISDVFDESLPVLLMLLRGKIAVPVEDKQ